MEVMENHFEEIIEANRRLRGIMREEHFSEGRGQENWRGRTDIYVDRKKESSRYRCREKVRCDE
jgi:3-deoxy-D-arabino-heptulosonate 7-phosphate (DAHP) synthase